MVDGGRHPTIRAEAQGRAGLRGLPGASLPTRAGRPGLRRPGLRRLCADRQGARLRLRLRLRLRAAGAAGRGRGWGGAGPWRWSRPGSAAGRCRRGWDRAARGGRRQACPAGDRARAGRRRPWALVAQPLWPGSLRPGAGALGRVLDLADDAPAGGGAVPARVGSARGRAGGGRPGEVSRLGLHHLRAHANRGRQAFGRSAAGLGQGWPGSWGGPVRLRPSRPRPGRPQPLMRLSPQGPREALATLWQLRGGLEHCPRPSPCAAPPATPLPGPPRRSPAAAPLVPG